MLVEYDSAADEWNPLCSPCKGSIPTLPNEDVRKWSQRRMALEGVDTNPDERGFMRGPLCIPPSTSTCPSCGGSLRHSLKIAKPDIIIRTYRGAIMRQAFDMKCAHCGHVRSWDPFSECILTINDGHEGGEHATIMSFYVNMPSIWMRNCRLSISDLSLIEQSLIEQSLIDDVALIYGCVRFVLYCLVLSCLVLSCLVLCSWVGTHI
jgi:hypothetical protein